MHIIPKTSHEVKYRLHNSIEPLASIPAVKEQDLLDIPTAALALAEIRGARVDYILGTSKRTGSKKLDLTISLNEIYKLPNTEENIKYKKKVFSLVKNTTERTNYANAYTKALKDLNGVTPLLNISNNLTADQKHNIVTIYTLLLNKRIITYHTSVLFLNNEIKRLNNERD